MDVREKLNITLTPHGKKLIEKISQVRGVSKSAIFEQFIRDEAARLNIKIEEDK